MVLNRQLRLILPKNLFPYRRPSAAGHFHNLKWVTTVTIRLTFVPDGPDQTAPSSLQIGTLFAPSTSHSPAISPISLNSLSELPSPSPVPSRICITQFYLTETHFTLLIPYHVTSEHCCTRISLVSI